MAPRDALTQRLAERDDAPDPGRRRFLVGGSITVSFALMPMSRALAQAKTEDAAPTATTAAAAKLPGNLASSPYLDAWIRIDEQGHITVYTGKVELGTGIRTALTQIAAEELGVDFPAINMITADTALTPNEGYTAGSHSTADSGTAILNAAAQVRALLLASAATKLGVDATTLHTRAGKIVASDGRSMSYGEAVSGVDLHQTAQPVSPLSDPAKHRVIGKPIARVDIPAKVTGGVSFVQDLRLPGMLHARVVRAPTYGAKLLNVDADAVQKMPGVVKVVRDGSYLAVVAKDEWQAIQAMRALEATASWQQVTHFPESDKIYDYLTSRPSRDIIAGSHQGPADPATKTLHAHFTKPYLSHGSIGPSCAVAHLQDGKMTVWTHTQGVFPLRGGLAEMLHMKPADIRCIHMQGSGCYGHNPADDVAADAALIARAVPGQPIRVQWMREHEHNCEPYNPAMITDLRASLDASGHVVQWEHEVWSNSHNMRIDNAGRLMPSTYLAQPFTPAAPQPIPMPEGDGDRNSVPLYAFPNYNVVYHFLSDMALRVSAMRGLGAFMNVFSIETFMDDLAQAAGADPVEFRLRHLTDSRGRDVINLAVKQFGWDPQRKPERGTGYGFSFAQYKNLMAYLAIAIEIAVDPTTGKVQIKRAVAAVDCGEIVNPDGVRNQIEGGILQSASWTLYERVRFDTDGVRTYDWSTYPIMRFADVPFEVEVHLIDRPGAKFLGAGEAAQGPTSAAVANAIFNATGRRLRDLPLAEGGKLRDFG